MPTEKNVLSGNMTMLVLKLLDGKDMYGYQIIEELAEKSEQVFQLKTGTLYPLLHGLEKSGMVISYEEHAPGQKMRRYYQLTKQGRGLLAEKQASWNAYTKVVGEIMMGGESYALA